ncbi:hypothetical protein Ddye_010327, partial [Dipteronia dyeriana]
LLYDELKENEMDDQFGFINPASVSLSSGLANTKRYIETSRMVVKSLENAYQSRYVFIPYNPRYHWILVVIDMLNMQIYYLDSLNGETDEYCEYIESILIRSA